MELTCGEWYYVRELLTADIPVGSVVVEVFGTRNMRTTTGWVNDGTKFGGIGSHDRVMLRYLADNN